MKHLIQDARAYPVSSLGVSFNQATLHTWTLWSTFGGTVPRCEGITRKSPPSHAAYVNFMKHFWGYCTVPRCKGITRKSPTIVQADIRDAYTLIYEASNPRCEGITRFNFKSWSQPSHVAYVNFMKHLGITYPVWGHTPLHHIRVPYEVFWGTVPKSKSKCEGITRKSPVSSLGVNRAVPKHDNK